MEQKLRTLDMLEVGETAQVHALRMHGTIRGRLQDIGLIRGTKVQCVLQSPSGSPKAYRIRGAVIALRTQDARDVEII